MGQAATTPVNEPQSVFVVPSSFPLTAKQIQQLHDEGQQPGVPFFIDDTHAQRPKGIHVKAVPIQNFISIRNDSIKLVFNKNKDISISFQYDSPVVSEAIIIIGGRDVSCRKGIRVFHQGKQLGPFQLEAGKNQLFDLTGQHNVATHVDDFLTLKALQQSSSQQQLQSVKDVAKSNEYDVIVLLIDKRVGELKRNYGYPIYEVSYGQATNSFSTSNASTARTLNRNSNRESTPGINLDDDNTPQLQNLRVKISQPKQFVSSTSSSSAILPSFDTSSSSISPAKPSKSRKNNNDTIIHGKDMLQTRIDEIHDSPFVLCEATFARIEGITTQSLQSLLLSSFFSTSLSQSSAEQIKDKNQPQQQQQQRDILVKTCLQRVKSSKSGDVYTLQEIYGLEQQHKSVDDNKDNNNATNSNSVVEDTAAKQNTVASNPTSATADENISETIDDDNDTHITYSKENGLVTHVNKTGNNSNSNNDSYDNSVTNDENVPSSSAAALNIASNESSPFNKKIDNDDEVLLPDNNENESEQQCVICLTDAKAIAVYPCRHFCMCVSCAEMLPAQQNKCPICRAAVYLLIQL